MFSHFAQHLQCDRVLWPSFSQRVTLNFQPSFFKACKKPKKTKAFAHHPEQKYGRHPILPAWECFFAYAIDAMSPKTAILPARECFFKFSHAPQLHKAQANELLAKFQHKSYNFAWVCHALFATCAISTQVVARFLTCLTRVAENMQFYLGFVHIIDNMRTVTLVSNVLPWAFAQFQQQIILLRCCAHA